MSLDSFRSKFKGDLVLPSDADYEGALARWAVNSQKRASVVAFVKDALDISEAIKYARSQKLDIAIRGGGHHASGASSTEGGLVIDLSRYLGDVRVDPAQQLAYVGGGALLEALDKKAIEHGLATVVGIINHTGVGGLILGGGYGFQSPAHGLAIDNMVQATVVTADGSILTASKEENPELFWAIRGSGSNFGVVPEIVMKLHPQRATVFAGVLVYPPSLVPQVAAAVDAWWTAGPSEKEVVYQIITLSPEGQPCIAVLLFYNGSEEEGRKNYKPFLDLNPVADMCAEVPYEKLNSLNNHMARHGMSRYFKSVFFGRSQKDVTPQIYERWSQLNQNNENVHFTVFHEYFPGGKISSVPSDATAFFHREKTCHAMTLATWNEDTPARSKLAKEGASELSKISADAENVSLQEGYGNYSADVDPSATKAQFGDNYERLQMLKQKFDPELIFNKWYPIVPAA